MEHIINGLKELAKDKLNWIYLACIILIIWVLL
jgi:hypothetical protein